MNGDNTTSPRSAPRSQGRPILVTALSAALCVLCVLCVELLHSQGRSAPDWTTEGADAQRSSWIVVDPWISLDAMSGFKFLWKLKVDNEARQSNALASPVSMANLNSFRGFKSLVFVGGSSNNVYAIDYDFGTLFWKTHFNYSSGVPEYAGSPACPGGMTAGLTRVTNLAPETQLPFMGFARPPRSARSAVGEPGKGAPQLTPGTEGRGRGAPARGRADAPAAPPGAPAVRGRGPNTIFAIPSDGIIRAVNAANGDTMATPAKLLTPNATASGLIYADGFLYAVTSSACGGAPDAVWAMDWSRDDKTVLTWKSNGASIAGPALGTDGTLYVATGDGSSAYANSVVALDSKTLQLKDWLTQSGVGFSLSPIVLSEGNRSYVAAMGNDGRLYFSSGEALGGSDHRTPLLSAPASAKPESGSLATWRDAGGTRWILAVTRDSAGAGRIVAFRLSVRNGTMVLEQGWVSRDLVEPRTPIVINGVVFALAAGRQSEPAVLYALNPETGKEIWNSGSTLTSFSTAGLSAGTGQVYVVTHDNTVWAFGIPQAN